MPVPFSNREISPCMVSSISSLEEDKSVLSSFTVSTVSTNGGKGFCPDCRSGKSNTVYGSSCIARVRGDTMLFWCMMKFARMWKEFDKSLSKKIK